ncbi:MAG: slipin family protein [Deltaproteobacteria bacterium]|nr:slipin family protein [Deltaproteobacteria bacterium]
MKIDVALNERVLVHENGRPTRYLAPGRHRIWAPFAKVELLRLDTEKLTANLRPEQLALIPAADLQIVQIGELQRGLVRRRGRPVLWLGPGEHAVWTVDRREVEGTSRSLIELVIFEVAGVETGPLPDLVRALVPASDYTEVTASEGTTVVRYLDGRLDRVLGPGRHAAWTVAAKVQFLVLDLRERLLAINGQEVMTKDRVSLRLNLAATYRVVDASRLATVARDADEVLYLAIQLAARQAIAGRTLDELLADREAIGRTIAPEVLSKAAALGLEVSSLGVKDVILSGELKTLLNRVIEAQKEAEANVITRREEIAAVRSMAQTAKALSESPVLLRLKELEAYQSLAGKVGRLNVVFGEVPRLGLSKGE